MSAKKALIFFVSGIVLGGLATSAVFISKQKNQSIDLSKAMGSSLFSVDGKSYTSSSLPGDASMEYYTLESNIYNAKKEFAAQVATRIALSKDAGKTVDNSSLPKMDELLTASKVTDDEAKQTYDQVLHQMGPGVFGGKSFEEIKAQLITKLSQQKQMQIVSNKAQELETKGRVQILLSKPEAPSVKLNVGSYPIRGNVNADVTLVEVADYLCPHCRQTQPAVESIYKEFSKKVKFVQVSFPLNPNGLSGALARGAYCANKQSNDLFWKYHELAFQVPFEKMQVKKGENEKIVFDNDAIDVAKNAGLDVNSFSTCLISAEAASYLKKVQSDFTASNGFQGTPAFYLNNKILELSPQQMESSLRVALSNK